MLFARGTKRIKFTEGLLAVPIANARKTIDQSAHKTGLEIAGMNVGSTDENVTSEQPKMCNPRKIAGLSGLDHRHYSLTVFDTVRAIEIGEALRQTVLKLIGVQGARSRAAYNLPLQARLLRSRRSVVCIERRAA
jgi:hypothetical protein